jgi:hypothetical protein
MIVTTHTAAMKAESMNIDFAAACKMSVRELHTAHYRAARATSNDVDGKRKAVANFWSDMIALRMGAAI